MTEQTHSETNARGAQRGALSGLRTRLGIVGELFAYLWAAKLWWLIPMVVALVAFSIFMIVAAATGGNPLIYTLF